MRLLVVGGSGLVGRLIVPAWATRHDVRVLDPHAPDFVEGVEHVAGTTADLDVLRAAMDGVDVLVYLAMGPMAEWGTLPNSLGHLEVSVKGTFAATHLANEAGIRRVVYASSLSVYQHDSQIDLASDPEPDAVTPYGLSKRLGEEVFKAAAAQWDMSVVALRLVWPRAYDEWLAIDEKKLGVIATAGPDVITAFDAALAHSETMGPGFVGIPIAGDRDYEYFDLSRAKQVLGWEPTTVRPTASAPAGT